MEMQTFTPKEQALAIINGLGGKANIKDVDNCATRLRVSVFNPEHVQKETLMKTGAKGVVAKGSGIQVIYGPEVTTIKNNVDKTIGEL